MSTKEGEDCPSPFIRFRLTAIDTVQLQLADYPEQEDTSSNVPFTLRVSPFFYKIKDAERVSVPLKSVPEIRVWGSTDLGQRCCVHIHGFLPYVYIEYKGDLNADEVQRYIFALGKALNLAMFYSFRGRNAAAKFDSAKDQYVGFITLCKGIPFYGFHVGYRYFLKIHALQPRYMRRLTDVLKAGTVVPKFKPRYGFEGTSSGLTPGCQVFEAHIPYLMQFMLDFNLFGCNWVELAQCTFRTPIPEDIELPLSMQSESSDYTKKFFTAETIPSTRLFEEEWLYRVSPEDSKTLEFDVHISDILNRYALKARDLHQDFTEFLHHPIPADAKLVYSVKGVWEDEKQRRMDRGESGPSETEEPASYERKYKRGEQPRWAGSDKHDILFQQMLEEDKERYMAKHQGKWPPTFETFVKPLPEEELIPTTFQSVTALFRESLERDEREANPYGAWAVRGIGMSRATTEDLVDEEAIAGLVLQIQADGVVVDEDAIADNERQASERRADQIKEKEDQALNEWENESSDFEDQEAQAIDEEALNQAPLPDRQGTEGPEDFLEPDIEELETFPSNDSSPVEQPGDFAAAEHINLSRHAEDDPDAPYVNEHGLGSLSNINFSTSSMPLSSQDSAKSVSKKRCRTPSSTINYFSSPAKSALKPNPKSGSSLRPDKDRLPLGLVDGESDRPVKRIKFNTPTASEIKGSSDYFSGGSELKEALYQLPLDDADTDMDVVSGDEQLSPTQQARSPSPLPPLSEKMILNSTAISSRTISFKSLAQEHGNHLQGSTNSVDSCSSTRSATVLQFSLLPPTLDELIDSLWTHRSSISNQSLPYKRYQDPFYSKPEHAPRRKKEFAGSVFDIRGVGCKWLPPFPHLLPIKPVPTARQKSDALPFHDVLKWEYCEPPPSLGDIKVWLANHPSGQTKIRNKRKFQQSQIDTTTQANPYGFKFTQMKSTGTSTQAEHMQVLTMELHAACRGNLQPNPKEDAIEAIFYCLHSETLPEVLETRGCKPECMIGCITLAETNNTGLDDGSRWGKRLGLAQYKWDVVTTETELIELFVKMVNAWDPEILAGYEIQNASWGYLLERSSSFAEMNLIRDLSRVTEQSTGRNERSDSWGYTKTSTIKITGRHVLPIWRLLRGQINLTSYTFESCVFHVLRRRTPYFSPKTLNKWFHSDSHSQKVFTYRYWLRRVEMDAELLDEAEIVSHTTEFARIYGVDFASVMNRGSQFKVESVLLRICKPESFVLISPSREEVGRQNALEAMPLIAEPQSAFYKDPVCVMDFQSLYPSVMIAYNFCFSTCLGRIEKFKGTTKFGVLNLDLPPGLLSLLKDHVNLSANGLIFVKEEVRRSTLAKMLTELLNTRVMVKSSMKRIKEDKALTRIYNARQLGLKLLANVTYGYCSATFSGRMPCAEIADAIVATGRQSLEKARSLIHSKPEKWGARVVYGDTDSLFVWLPGKTRDQAHDIGEDMAEKVSMLNPEPVKLKFEKVYLPCVLASKKRYIGFKYEYRTEKEASFDAKGIETVRRDGFPAMQKMVESTLRILFTTQDLTKVKEYCEAQWSKFYTGQVSPQDFIFAKEVKLGTYSVNGIPPPGAVIADQRLRADPRDEVQYGERVPFIIPQAIGNQNRLVDRAVQPLDFLKGEHRLDAAYHIKHTINALNRVFTLLGVNVADWQAVMPKVFRVKKRKELAEIASQATQIPIKPSRSSKRADPKSKKPSASTLDTHFKSDRCVVCGRDQIQKNKDMCVDCERNVQQSAYTLFATNRLAFSRRDDIQRICATCSELPALEEQKCVSTDCPMLYTRFKSKAEVAEARTIQAVAEDVWTPNRLKELARLV